MISISADAGIQTVITTFDVTPATCDDLIAEIQAARAAVVSKAPGFVGSAMHVNDARTRIANYTQWRTRDDFLAMLRSDEMRPHMKRWAELSKSFEPVLYDVVATSA